MGGGGVQQTENQQSQLATTESNIAQQYFNMSQQQLAKSNTLEQPLINYYTAATSGNQNALLTAAAPQIGNISQQTQAAEANIMNNVPAGAGRDFALAQARVGQGSQVASALNNAYTGGLQGLAQLGAGQATVGLQEAGAGISGTSGAQAGLSNVGQEQSATKASQLGFLGSIFGAAGSAAGGYLSNI